MTKLLPFFAACLFCAGPFSSAAAQYSHHTIAFQGYLTDDLGAPLNDDVPITFKIYRTLDSFLLWTEAHPSVTVVDGIFNVALGTITSLESLDFDREYSVGISVDSDPEMSPRTPLTAVPFAMNLAGALRVGLVDDEVDVFAADNIIGGKGHVAADVVGGTVSGGGNTDEFGHRNRVYADYGSVGGGYGNQAGAFTEDNIAKTNHEFATVGGGYFNAAGGRYSTVPGGYLNRALGRYSFAAGARSEALHDGTFVWSDTSSGFFSSTGWNQFLIRAGGGVGIGTAYPGSRVTITRPAQAQAYQLELRNEGSITTPNFDGIRFSQVTNPSDTPTDLAWIKVPYLNFGGADMEFGLRFHDEPILYLKNMGNFVGSPVRVGVGTAAPSVEFEVNGALKAVTVTETSDARYKRDVTEVSGALASVSALRGVRYEWDREAYPGMVFSDSPQLGFLAQEVREVVPEVVSANDDGSLSIAYGKLVPLLVEAIKEQQTQIQSLQEELRSMKAGM